MAQVFPPENGQGPARFRRWYLDDVTGAMISEFDAVRDQEGRLTCAEDRDAPSRDDLSIGYDTPLDRALNEEHLE